ncbi:HAMP domain-containing sensor histidine kinase [Arthrobacter oryzae]|uniref:sensor histidine kinase n=1 Tax=Arthrobacter oryzae TaxID=409290 RepID=UPI00285F406D|nr:HAMP domain-containing sensor histidine kinase [Arthrobacter oryzae]MDR6506923.1 signal transduction histidine kinase [Arthrobacter oryzae]
MSQLPLSVTLFLVAIAAAIFSPATLADDGFRIALLAHVTLFGLCLAVPWGRLHPEAFTLIPVLDCVAIGFTRQAGGPSFNVLSLLLVFPVVWLSVSRHRHRVVLAVLATVLSTVVPAAALGSDPAQGSVIRTIFLPLVMAAIAVTAHVLAGALYRQRMTLIRKDRDLAATLAESVQRQRLLDAVLSTVDVGVWVVDEVGQEVLTNRALRTDPSLARVASAGGSAKLFHGDRTTPVPADAFPAVRASRGESFTHELYWTGEDSEQRAYSVSGGAIRSLAGIRAGAVVTFADVTTLINALAAKDNFVATVSHELRTPLTSILGYLELVLDEPGHEDIAAELRIVERNAGHLLGLVNDLIAVASENVELVLQDTDLADLLAAAVAANQARADLSGVALVLDAEEPLPARVDPARIRQVVGNLISNAVKYSPDGGQITARARRNGEELVCSITDTGVGMTEEDQEQAFTKFFRSARSRDTAIPGAGLGLPISKTIIEGHGGSIGLISAPGEGTTVTFTLPADPR